MTDSQKLKRLYIILRWYDSHVRNYLENDDEILEEDVRLMRELEKEMLEIQKRANSAKPRKKRK
jgi:hypothetical protein